jgi:outer membrane immunogenic protein
MASRIAMITASVLTIGAASVAQAADLEASGYQRTYGYVDMNALPTQWAGPYVGLLAGYGTGTSRFSGINSGGKIRKDAAFSEGDLKGATMGGYAGANFQLKSFVFGVEGDLNWSAFKGSSTVTDYFIATDTADMNARNYGTLRGRVGYAFDRFLPYFTGGLYWSQTDMTLNESGSLIRRQSDSSGWVVGGGLEVALTNHWSIKGEYLHAQLSPKYQIDKLDDGTPIGDVIETSAHEDIFRAGVGYHF